MIPFQYLAFEVLRRQPNTSAGFPATGSEYATAVEVVELTDTVRYGIVSYAPTLSPFVGNTLTTNSEFPRVSDTLTVHVFGGTVAQCLANYEALIAVIDQANRWVAGDVVLGVQISAQTQCSTIRTTAMVFGGEGPPTAVAPELEVSTDPGSRWVLRDVTVTIVRQGRWMDSLVDDSDLINKTGFFTDTPIALTFTNDQGALPAPTLVDVAFVSTTASTTKPGFFIISPDLYTEVAPALGRGVRINDASTLTATNWTTVNDAANFPFQGTNILRLTRPSTTDTTFWPTAPIDFYTTSSRVETDGRLWAIFAGVRNNTATVDFFIRAAYSRNFLAASPVINFRTRPVLVSGSDTTPQVVSLGVVPMTNRQTVPVSIVSGLRLEVAASAATGAATFDVSYIACVSVDSPATTITQIFGSGSFDLINAEYGNSQLSGVSDSIGTAPTISNDLSGRGMRTFNGDSQFETINNRAYVLFLYPGVTGWQPRNGGAGADMTYAMRRRRAYRSPQ